MFYEYNHEELQLENLRERVKLNYITGCLTELEVKKNSQKSQRLKKSVKSLYENGLLYLRPLDEKNLAITQRPYSVSAVLNYNKQPYLGYIVELKFKLHDSLLEFYIAGASNSAIISFGIKNNGPDTSRLKEDIAQIFKKNGFSHDQYSRPKNTKTF